MRKRRLCVFAALFLCTSTAEARPSIYSAWDTLYPSSSSDDILITATGKTCQLCHRDANGGEPWNPYGWQVRVGIYSGLTVDEAIVAAESYDSDGDPGSYGNLDEINASSQPGWTTAGNSTTYNKDGTTGSAAPPAGVTPLDPEDTPVLALTARSTDGQNLLEWANPSSGSYASTMIRYSTTGFPANESDGTLLVEKAGGATDSHVHLTPNGTTVYYAAFVRYSYGGFSSPVTTHGTPMSTAGPVKWSYSTGATNLEPPGIGSVVGVSNDNRVHHTSGGATGGAWIHAPALLNAPVMHRPMVSPFPVGAASKAILVSTSDGFVNAIDATNGSSVWTSPNLVMLIAAPSISFSEFGGTDQVFVGTRNSGGVNALYALDLDTGTEDWHFDASGAGTGVISGQVDLDYSTQRIFFGSRARSMPGDPTLWCISYLGGVPPQVWAVDAGDIDGSPILAHGRVYVGNVDGEVIAVDATTGAELWRLPLGDGPIKGYVLPDWASNNLYVSTTNTLWSLSDNTYGGSTPPNVSVNWSDATIPNPSTPLFIGGVNLIWVGASDGKLYELDATGSVKKSVQVALTGTAIGSPALDVVGSFLHLGAENGVLYTVGVPLP